MKRNYVIIPLIIIAVALLGSRFTNIGMDWYSTLNLHPWTPSGTFIGIVRSIIFALSCVSVLLFWNKPPYDRKFGILTTLFVDNAILNVLRSYLFFVKHMMLWSIADMVLLWLITLILVIALRSRSKLASILLMPYVIWVAVATFFAYQVHILNLL